MKVSKFTVSISKVPLGQERRNSRKLLVKIFSRTSLLSTSQPPHRMLLLTTLLVVFLAVDKMVELTSSNTSAQSTSTHVVTTSI